MLITSTNQSPLTPPILVFWLGLIGNYKLVLYLYLYFKDDRMGSQNLKRSHYSHDTNDASFVLVSAILYWFIHV